MYLSFSFNFPIGYAFLVTLGLVALLSPEIIFNYIVNSDSGWIIIGWVGGFILGIGLFNFVAIIIKQYLGHWLSIICFGIGSILMVLSYLLCL